MPKRGQYIGRMLQTYRRNARLRGVEWQLSREQFTEIVTRDCAYCGEPPRTRVYHMWNRSAKASERFESKERVNGIDRVDNALGYTPENSATCCARCNGLKSAMSRADLLTHIAKILAHLRPA